MTESVYVCAASLCCCLIVCSVLRIISPYGSTQKIMTLVISVFAVCSLIAPFTSLVNEFRESYKHNVCDESITDKIQLKTDEEVAKLAAEYLNDYVNTLLLAKGITDSEIRTILSYDADSVIKIKELNIYLNKTYSSQTDEIKNLICSNLGVIPNVTELNNE
mgnify:CR=1 FL=1